MTNAEVVRALGSPEVRARLAPGGTVPVAMTPEDFAAMIRRQTDLVGKIVQAAKIEPVD